MAIPEERGHFQEINGLAEKVPKLPVVEHQGLTGDGSNCLTSNGLETKCAVTSGKVHGAGRFQRPHVTKAAKLSLQAEYSLIGTGFTSTSYLQSGV